MRELFFYHCHLFISLPNRRITGLFFITEENLKRFFKSLEDNEVYNEFVNYTGTMFSSLLLFAQFREPNANQSFQIKLCILLINKLSNMYEMQNGEYPSRIEEKAFRTFIGNISSDLKETLWKESISEILKIEI